MFGWEKAQKWLTCQSWPSHGSPQIVPHGDAAPKGIAPLSINRRGRGTGEGGWGLMLMVVPESSCLVLISQHIKILLLKQSVTTARVFFPSNGVSVVHNKYKLNIRFSGVFFLDCKSSGVYCVTTVCVCVHLGVCEWVRDTPPPTPPPPKKGGEAVQRWLPLLQKCRVSFCPSGLLFHPCHWKSHYVVDYVHNWLSRWMAESAVLDR